jgi:hypothetical protein
VVGLGVVGADVGAIVGGIVGAIVGGIELDALHRGHGGHVDVEGGGVGFWVGIGQIGNGGHVRPCVGAFVGAFVGEEVEGGLERLVIETSEYIT